MTEKENLTKTYAEAMIAETLYRSMAITLDPKASLALIKNDASEIVFMRDHHLQLFAALIFVLTNTVNCKKIDAEYKDGDFTVKITI
jgi:hypothetical protein